jgi:hypothetical protein
LTFEIRQCGLKGAAEIEDIVNNDPSVSIKTHFDTAASGNHLPGAIDILHHNDKDWRTIDRAKWHDIVSPLDGIHASKG